MLPSRGSAIATLTPYCGRHMCEKTHVEGTLWKSRQCIAHLLCEALRRPRPSQCGGVREAETGNSAPFVQCNCMLCLQPLGTSLRARASGVQCFVGVSVTIGDDLLFVCDDRCAKQPLLNQSRMMK